MRFILVYGVNPDYHCKILIKYSGKETIVQIINSYTLTFLCLSRIIDSKKGFGAKATTIFQHNRLESASNKVSFLRQHYGCISRRSLVFWGFGVCSYIIRSAPFLDLPYLHLTSISVNKTSVSVLIIWAWISFKIYKW